MADRRMTIVPLDASHEVFAAFGIGPTSKAYKRWRRDDGFRLVDIEGVLAESQFLLLIDHREWLKNALDTVVDQVGAIGVSMRADLGAEGEQGYIEVDGKREAIKFVPKDDDDFDKVIGSVNSLIRHKGRYRKFQSCEDSAGWSYGLLQNEDWQAIESNAPELVNCLFVPEAI